MTSQLLPLIDVTCSTLKFLNTLGVQCSPIVQGAALSPKYQLKQELYVNFFDFKSTVPLVIDISYK